MTCAVVTRQMFDSHFPVVYCWPVSEKCFVPDSSDDVSEEDYYDPLS